MGTSIKTNKLLYKLDRQAIASEYDLFTIETSDKYIKRGAYILDAPTLNRNVKSIVFESGRRALMMMHKDDHNRALIKELISGVEGGSKLSVAETKIQDVQDWVLLQLLLNALSSYDSNFLKFNNLTGHLYCFHPEWVKRGKEKKEDMIWKIPCMEFRVTRDYCIEMSVRTFTSERLKKKISFTKRKFEDYPKYVVSKDNTLRRRLSDDTEPGFIMRQIDGTKSEIPFLDFQNEKKFDQCKVGTLAKVIEAFNSKYGSLAFMECGYMPESGRIDYSKSAAKEDFARVRGLLSALGVHIVDQIGDTYSEQFANNMCTLLLQKYEISASVGKRIKKDALNICVIHNAEYYEGVQDPHDNNYDGVAVQHVTLEDFADNAEFAISTVIHEVLIKRDLEARRITLFDWEELGLEEDISFGTESKSDEETKYFFMKVHPDGSFDIQEQEFTLFEMNEYTDCVNIFEDAKTKGETVKGLIRDGQGRINIIKDTGIITLPEAEEIKNLLASGDTKLRGRERREELLSSCLDIKIYMEDGKQFYYVGTIGEGMRWKIPRAANVRCIEGYQGAPLMFDKLLPTMNVTFVHNGQLTVLPFPFKYLREFIRDLER